MYTHCYNIMTLQILAIVGPAKGPGLAPMRKMGMLSLPRARPTIFIYIYIYIISIIIIINTGQQGDSLPAVRGGERFSVLQRSITVGSREVRARVPNSRTMSRLDFE